MKQIRLQLLSKTYQKLGTLICNMALSIQSTDYTVNAEWERLILQGKQTFTAFKSYAAMEENILFPLLHNYEPALVAILRDTQYIRIRYLNDLSELIDNMQSATDKHKSKLFSHKLLYRFDEFVASTLQQINEYEKMINEVFWRYYSDKELEQIAASLNSISVAATSKKAIAFADHVIKSILPASVADHIHKTRVVNKGYKQSRASKILAIAI